MLLAWGIVPGIRLHMKMSAECASQLETKRAFSAVAWAALHTLGRCPRLTMNAAPLARNAYSLLAKRRFNRAQSAIGPHRREVARNLPARRARKPEENCRADACDADRTLPIAAPDRCEDRAGARITLALLFSGRADASTSPAKTSTEEILPRCPAIHRCPLPVVDSEAPTRPALIRVQSPRPCCERAHH